LGRGKDWGRKRARKEKWRGEERKWRKGREGQTPPEQKFWLRP